MLSVGFTWRLKRARALSSSALAVMGAPIVCCPARWCERKSTLRDVARAVAAMTTARSEQATVYAKKHV